MTVQVRSERTEAELAATVVDALLKGEFERAPTNRSG